MPPPLLLVHDDLATIASVRRALTRAGTMNAASDSFACSMATGAPLRPVATLNDPGSG